MLSPIADSERRASRVTGKAKSGKGKWLVRQHLAHLYSLDPKTRSILAICSEPSALERGKWLSGIVIRDPQDSVEFNPFYHFLVGIAP